MKSATAVAVFSLVLSVLVTRFVAFDVPDTQRYVNLAEHLAKGEGFTACVPAPNASEVFRSPGYPVFLMAHLLAGGRHLSAIVPITQAILRAIAVFLLALIARRFLPAQHSLLAATVVAVYLPSVVYVANGSTEALAEFLAVSAVYFLLRALDDSIIITSVIAGFLFGILSLTRPAFVLLPFAITGLALVLRKHRKTSTVVLLTSVLTMLPWVVRTSLVLNRIVPSGAVGGIGWNMYYGTLDYRLPLAEVERRRAADADVNAITTSCDAEVVATADSRLAERAKKRIAADKSQFVAESAYRLFRIWVSTYHPKIPPPVLLVISASMSCVLAGGIYGAWCLRRDPQAVLLLIAPVLYVTLVHAPMHVDARYSVPVRPLLLLLGVVAVRDLRLLERITRLRQSRSSGAHDPLRR